MRNDSELAKRNLELSFEFSRFVLANPEVEGKIPENAVVIFDIADDPELTAYNRRMSETSREGHQPVIVVHIKGLAPTRLIEPTVSLASG